MKRLIWMGFVLSVLSGPFAFAQGPFIGGTFRLDTLPFGNGGTGQNPSLMAVGLQAGDYGLLGGVLGPRIGVNLNLGDTMTVEASADALIPFTVGNVIPYGGAGVNVAFSPEIAFSPHAVGGVEFMFGPGVGIYAEVDPALVFRGTAVFEAQLRFGLNYHF